MKRLSLAPVVLLAALTVAGCTPTSLGPGVSNGPPTPETTQGQAVRSPAASGAQSEPSTSYVPITDPRLRLIREIKVGSCFNENVGADGVGHGYLIVPCTGSHELEMYGRGEIEPSVSEYPDADGLAAEGDRNCRPLFAEYVGLDYNQSQYTFWSYYPHPDDWPDDRTIHCALGNASRTPHDGGSAKDSRQ